MSKTKASFINVEGDDLESRLNAAYTRARAESRSALFYWVAYKFAVRSNVSLDTELVNTVGQTSVLAGVIIGNVGQYETRNVGVFLLYEQSAGHQSSPVRIEIYNLDRERDYERRPVYWLGEAETAESLKLLESLLRRTNDEVLGGKLAEAIALHAGEQVEELLAQLARGAKLVMVRAGAVFWLGRLGQRLSLVEEVAGDGRENVRVRQQAIIGIGKSRSPGALDTLRRLAGMVREHLLQEAIVNAIAQSRHRDAEKLLNAFAERSDDAVLSRRARLHLLKASGAKSRMKEAKRATRARKERSWRLWK